MPKQKIVAAMRYALTCAKCNKPFGGDGKIELMAQCSICKKYFCLNCMTLNLNHPHNTLQQYPNQFND
jgi:hypothetical protein